jgi:hypothetical protein
MWGKIITGSFLNQWWNRLEQKGNPSEGVKKLNFIIVTFEAKRKLAGGAV